MKKLKIILAAVSMLAVASIALAARDQYNSPKAENATRACVPAVGGVAIRLAATTIADADSGALSYTSTYMMRCATDAWVRFGSVAVNALANDWRINSGEVYYISTGGSELMSHISALSVSANGDCLLLECK